MTSRLRDVQLELSLKAFPGAAVDEIRSVARELASKWGSLIRHADSLSVLLWVGDGTELLEYDGSMERIFPWAFWIGRGADRHPISEEKDPHHESLDGYPKMFTAEPKEYRYADLRRIVLILRETLHSETGKPVHVGTILEPGGEFLKSDWKYERHPECLFSGNKQQGYHIDAISVLHADAAPYAGFPGGLPEGTPWGTFFGRQTQCFVRDMGFDFLWMSNGYGMARSPYAYGWCGAFFNGSEFLPEGNRETREKILEFWRLFRAECPALPVRLRGTDFVVGMDLVNHAVPYRELLDGRFGTTQPPNTPWPALTSNFGLALAGFMGRMSVSSGPLPYRMYTSDPWWANSAWVDSFNRSPHDIYLNLSLAAVQAEGPVKTADCIDFLSVDTSWGDLPEWIPDEVIGHIKHALRHAPDQAGPLVWVYPFDEYEQMAQGGAEGMARVFSGDIFFQESLGNFLPVNTVVSSANFIGHIRSDSRRYAEHLLISPVPPAGSPLEAALRTSLSAGGSLLLYGPLAAASDAWLETLQIRNKNPLSGEFDLDGVPHDEQPAGADAGRLFHNPALAAGGLTETPLNDAGTGLLHSVTARQGPETRVLARALRCAAGGTLVWLRGGSSVNAGIGEDADPILLRSMTPYPTATWFRSEKLARLLLPHFGYEVALVREQPRECARHMAVSRHRNAFRFTFFSEERGMKLRLRFPLGAPMLEGEPVDFQEGAAIYRFHRFLHAECRIFVKTNDSAFLDCRIVQSLHPCFRHRVNLVGLQNASVSFFPPYGDRSRCQVLLNPDLRLLVIGDAFEQEEIRDGFGVRLDIRNVSGILSFAW